MMQVNTALSRPDLNGKKLNEMSQSSDLDLNLTNMKKRLDLLLQQTNKLASKKKEGTNLNYERVNYASNYMKKEKQAERETTGQRKSPNHRNSLEKKYQYKTIRPSTQSSFNNSQRQLFSSTEYPSGAWAANSNFSLISSTKTYQDKSIKREVAPVKVIQESPLVAVAQDSTSINLASSIQFASDSSSLPNNRVKTEADQKQKQKQKQSQRSENEQLLVQCHKIQMQNTSLSANLSQINAENTQLKSVINSLEQQLKTANDKLIAQLEAMKSYDNKFNQLSQEHDKKISGFEKEYEDKTSQLKKEYEGIIAVKNEQIEKLMKKCTSSTSNVPEYSEQVIKNHFDHIHAENLAIMEQFETQSSQIAKLNIENAHLQQQVAKFKQQWHMYAQHLQQMQNKWDNIMVLIEKKKNPFEQILSLQLTQIKGLRQRVNLLEEEKNTLRQNITENLQQIDRLNQEKSFVELKERALRNNAITEFGILITNQGNSIQSLSRKLETLQYKYKSATKDIKAKDQFFKQYLLGRTDDQSVKKSVTDLFEIYQVGESEDQKLKEELATMRKKLELYEAVN